MKQKLLFLVFCLLIISGAGIFFAASRNLETRPLTIAMLDIGQGDAIYIETPSGKTMLIDSGRDRQILYELGDILPLGKRHIDIIENSNPDLDHIGGFPFVLEEYSVGTILSAGTNHETLEAFGLIEEKAREKQIPIIRPKAGTVLTIDGKAGVTYTILWPEENVRDWERNAGSMVGLLEYAGHKVLFTGDAPKEVEDAILARYGGNLSDIDILKVGHHGSRTSTSETFLRIAQPKIALISAGKGNRYGHPHNEVTQLLQKHGTRIFLTATDGRIVCRIWENRGTNCE